VNSRSYWFVLLVSVFLLVGCASPARVDQMMTSGQPTQRVEQTPLRGNVAVKEVTGGKETNPMWMSNVGSNEFTQALEGSLRTVGLLAPNRQEGRFSLTAHLQRLDQPMFGLDMTVTAAVDYVVVERSTGKSIFQKTIAVPYTAKFGDAFVGVERLKLANEGAVRTSISQLIDELFQLKIEDISIAVSPLNTKLTQTGEDQLKELKRLNDAGLITKDVYLERQKAILEKSK
jgi:outer membrane murein-binding lipoprotein Lpp